MCRRFQGLQKGLTEETKPLFHVLCSFLYIAVRLMNRSGIFVQIRD